MTESGKLSTLLSTYKSDFSEEQEQNLLMEDHCFERKNLKGHFTGSCWVTNESFTQVLLLHHVKLDRWLQPGGHADGEEDLLAVAKKELVEETGINDVIAGRDQLFDIDIHEIPKRKNIPVHEHFDARFHFIVRDNISLVINEESNALQWVPIDQVINLTNGERSFERMVMKTKALTI